MKKILSMTLYVIAFASLSSNSQAQVVNSGQSNSPPAQNIKAWLKANFAQSVSTCVSGKKAQKAMNKLPKGPSILYKHLDGSGFKSFYSHGNASGTSFLNYVFSKSEITSGKFQIQNNGFLPTKNWGIDASKLNYKIGNFFVSSQTCDAALKVAAKAGGGLAGLFEASAEARLSGKAQMRTDIAIGQFDSPFINKNLNANSFAVSPLANYFLFWDWRNQNGDIEGYLLNSISGMAFLETQQQQSSRSLFMAASGGINFAVFSASAEAETGLELSDRITAVRRDFLFRVPVSNDPNKFYQIPSSTELSKFITDRLVPDYEVQGENDDRKLIVKASNIPEHHCLDRADYSIDGTHKGVKILTISNVTENDQEFCQMALDISDVSASSSSGIDLMDIQIVRKTTSSKISPFRIDINDVPLFAELAPRLVIDYEKDKLAKQILGSNTLYRFELPALIRNEVHANSNVIFFDPKVSTHCAWKDSIDESMEVRAGPTRSEGNATVFSIFVDLYVTGDDPSLTKPCFLQAKANFVSGIGTNKIVKPIEIGKFDFYLDGSL